MNVSCYAQKYLPYVISQFLLVVSHPETLGHSYFCMISVDPGALLGSWLLNGP